MTATVIFVCRPCLTIRHSTGDSYLLKHLDFTCRNCGRRMYQRFGSLEQVTQELISEIEASGQSS